LKNNILKIFIQKSKIYEIRNVSDFEAKKVQIFDHETGEAVRRFNKETEVFEVYLLTCDKEEPSISVLAKELKTVFIASDNYWG